MDAYKMLNLRDQKRKGIAITDEMVQKNYLAIRESYLKMSEKGNKINSQNEKEIKLERAEGNLNGINSEEMSAMQRRKLFRFIAKSI